MAERDGTRVRSSSVAGPAIEPVSSSGSQGTIAREVECSGIGLHGGRASRVRLLPQAQGGRCFVTASGVEIPATIAHVESDARATVLADGDAQVRTVEHLLAALQVSGIDHVRIEVEGDEVPALDGSAAPWCALLAKAGRRALAVPARPVTLSSAIEIQDGNGRFIRAEPAPGLSIDYTIDFPIASIGRQRCQVEPLDARHFAEQLAPARTFALREEVEALRVAGLALGGSLDNALVLEEGGPMGDVPLRFSDECVRHKVVDLVGDLALLGAPLGAQVIAERAGHRLHHALVRAIDAQRRENEADAPGRLALLVARSMGNPWSESQLSSALTDPKGEIRSEWEARSGDAVGCVLARWTDEDLIEIDIVAVHPGHRRRGIARRLLASLMGEARRCGLREARLELATDNEEALSLYTGLGFVVVGRRARYYPDGSDALLLSWNAERSDT